MTTIEKSLSSVISRLTINRHIPKYQFERASEPFLSFFIEEALGVWLNTSLTFVVPEFPLKKSDNSQSTNADYLFKADSGAWLLVEVKTETGTIRPEQLEVYVVNKNRKFESLVSDITSIVKDTNDKKKYEYLLKEIGKYTPELKGPLRIIYITPHKESPIASEGIEWVSFETLFSKFKSTKHPELWSYVSILVKGLYLDNVPTSLA